MSLTVGCSKCGKNYKVADDKAGKKIKCAGCGAIIAIPEPTAAANEEVDAWDLPPAEDSSLPPIGRSPRHGSSRGREGSSSKKQKSGGGMPPVLKVILIIFGGSAALALVACGGCYFVVQRGVKQFQAESDAMLMKNQPAPENVAADGTPIPLFDLAKLDYMMQSHNFLSKYKDQTVEIRGTCFRILGGPGHLTLWASKNGSGEFDVDTLTCELKDQLAPFSKVFPRQVVTLRFKSPGLPDVGHPMKDVEVIKAEGPAYPQITPELIARDRATLKDEEFDKKHTYQECVFTGTITERLEGNEIVFQPTDKVKILSRLFQDEPTVDQDAKKVAIDISKVKKGDRLRGVGGLQWRDGEGLLTLYQILPAN